MKISKGHIISQIEPGSIAEELELEPGDTLLSINGNEMEDVFDYHFLINDDYLVLLVEKKDGQEWELEIEKDYYEDLGLVFEKGLMDDYKSCSNKCIFCFIDQMPPGMRETLYFKDDDSRLSFLQGNYITLTNMKDKDLDRIIRLKLAPINISVHTTNPKLRCQMLNNRFAGAALKKIDKLYKNHIEMNGQIVLCKGVNDGKELERTISDLAGYMPYMESLSVVPVGLTKYREGLFEMESFTREDAREVIDIIEKWQDICYEKHGSHFVQASDEWYILAERELPEEERYDGYIQLENGVGMLRLLMSEFDKALKEAVSRKDEIMDHLPDNQPLTIATGKLAAPFLQKMAESFMEEFPGTSVEVVPIRNDFFGEKITVSGLITGQDLVKQLNERGKKDRVAIPCSMMKMDEEIFLDDLTLDQVEKALQVPVLIVKSSGQDLLNAMICR